MDAQDRAIQKLARDLASMKKELVSWRGPQADYTSIENSGNFTFKDGDGNVTAVVGGQDDGSNTIRHVDGPVPPIPSGLSAHVDGPIVQVSWDGSFEDADNATYDWSHLEVIAVGPSNENLRGTISDATGASTNLAATSSGVWTVVARSVSRAEKRSLDGDAGTVTVELVGLTGAINDAIGSANGKNTVTYSETAPTPADEGIPGDTWWVGQVGRPNDVVEATNLATNPSFENGVEQPGFYGASGGGSVASTDTAWSVSGTHSLKVGRGSSSSASRYIGNQSRPSLVAGRSYTIAVTVRRTAVQAGSLDGYARGLNVVGVTSSGGSDWGFGVTQAPNVPGVTRLVLNVDVPSDYRGACIRLMNGSTTADTWWDDLVIQEAVTSGAFFDGDTPSGTTDNESHYRWTGTPHASTSEKYLPALSIGDSDNWNITEQYQFTASGWLPVELSHQVFSSVDLGKATVGELDGIRIMGQTIRGEQLSGDAIDGKVITGATYRTSGGSGSWSDDGLFIAQPDGTSMVRFPTDGSPLSLTASDVQIDRASITDLDLSYGAVRSGGQVTLASGVTAPVSPPELTTGWQKVCTLPAPPERSDVNGLAYWGSGDGFWVRAVNVLGVGEGDRIELYDYGTGGLVNSFPINLDPQHGITVIGDIVYIVGKDHDRPQSEVYVFGYDLNTGARTSRARMDVVFDYKVAVGNDGTNVVTASVTKNGNLHVLRWNPVTGAQVGSDWSGVWQAGGRELLGVHVSGSEVTILPQQTARVYTVSGTTLTRKTDAANASGFAGWDNPNKNGAGMVWRGTFPCVVDRAGVVYQGSLFASDAALEVCFVWTNGTYYTTPSPIATIDQGARQETTISLPVRAGLSKRVYTRTAGAANWAKHDIAENVTSARVSGGVEIETLPTTNTFPNADPATLKSTNDKFEVKGDGSGHWGNFNVDANGAMSGIIVTGTVLVQPDQDGHAKKVTISLPDGRFTKPPVVWVQASTSVPHNVATGVIKQEITTDTFNLYMTRIGTTTATGVTWFAMDSE